MLCMWRNSKEKLNRTAGRSQGKSKEEVRRDGIYGGSRMKNFLKHEFIGLPVKVLKATDKSLEGVEGEIIDETKKHAHNRKPRKN